MTAPIICVAIGNSLRGDDGVAHRVVELLGSLEDVDFFRVNQLTPELAERIAGAGQVIFVDADTERGTVRIEPVSRAAPVGAPISHTLSLAAVVELAERLYAFRGRTFVCRVPGVAFDPGEELSAEAEANAHRASELISAFCAELR